MRPARAGEGSLGDGLRSFKRFARTNMTSSSRKVSNALRRCEDCSATETVDSTCSVIAALYQRTSYLGISATYRVLPPSGQGWDLWNHVPVEWDTLYTYCSRCSQDYHEWSSIAGPVILSRLYRNEEKSQ
jgi:hypothetical protein